MARTARKISDVETRLLTQLGNDVTSRVQLKAQYDRDRDAALAVAQTKIDAKIADLRSRGVPVSVILSVLGTTNPNRVYEAMARHGNMGAVVPPVGDTHAVIDYVTVENGRVTGTDVPPDAWTYPDTKPRPTDVWSGWVDIEGGMLTGWSESPNPLWGEYLWGTDDALRKAVGE